MARTDHYDVICIGGGSGLTAAYHAQQDGRSIALVDALPDQLGGTCVNRGCIPTKDLIQTAEVMNTIRSAEAFGIEVDAGSVRVDFEAVMQRVRRRREAAAAQTREWVESAMTPYYGHARFVEDKVLEMDDGRRLTADRIFIASGARPAIPPIEGLDTVDYLTNVSVVLDLAERPDRLIVLGGGYIGCEFAHFFAGIGTRVTLVDREPCLLGEDEDIRRHFTEEFGRKVDLRLGVDVVRAFGEDGACGLVLDEDGEQRTVHADRLLVATGRRPNTDGLGLDRTGVDLDERGNVAVDEHLRTSHPDIYAYGDVIGQAMFKHTSSYEGGLAYANAYGGERKIDYRANPHAVFGDPQIGAVGLTERACREQGLQYRVACKDYADVAKGRILGSPPGFAKLLVEEKTDRILGFHMLGPGASDLIHEVVVAMNAGDGTAGAVRDSIHVHPTMPELIQAVFAATG